MNFRDLARAALAERSSYTVAAADKLGVSELIIEKDFWVVWILERLFALSPKLGPFTFKGGTSLSKGFKDRAFFQRHRHLYRTGDARLRR